jgi:pimeloyl-ACP methyl ester carboxylesterase
MPYADNKSVRIHYEVEGTGLPLVLQHGFTQSIEDWHDAGYVDALKGAHRLILVDARGHGASDKPHEPKAYRLEDFAGDVVAVLDALAIQKADFWGYSMGGWVGFGMTGFAPERIDRLVIGGQHPFARSREGFRQLLRTGIAQGHDAFLAAVEQGFGTLAAGHKARLHQADLDALMGVVAQDPGNFEALLLNITAPCCLYVGEADPFFPEAKRASGLIPDARFFSLLGLNHLEGFVRSDLVLPHVTTFLRRSA